MTKTNTFNLPSTAFFFGNGAVQNQVIQFQSKNLKPKPPFVFVANWRAKPKHWKEFIAVLTEEAEVHYFESREKKSAKLKTENVDYTVEAMGSDLANYLNQLEGPYHLIGVSINTSSIIKSWVKIKQKPLSVTFICPVINLVLPWYFKLFPFIPESLIKFIRPIVYQFMMISKSTGKLSKNLTKAFKDPNITELKKIKASAEGLLKLHINPTEELGQISSPTMIIYALNDPIHPAKDGILATKKIPNTTTFTVSDFRAAHQHGNAYIILDWLFNLQFKS